MSLTPNHQIDNWASEGGIPAEPHRDHQDGCLLCAVRALTEGTPPVWKPTEGDTVRGVVLARGEHPGLFGTQTYVDLYVNGHEGTDMEHGVRVRLIGGTVFENHLSGCSPHVGDTLTVKYLGRVAAPQTKVRPARMFRDWAMAIRRGH
jgi:hypothetical protein